MRLDAHEGHMFLILHMNGALGACGDLYLLVSWCFDIAILVRLLSSCLLASWRALRAAEKMKNITPRGDLFHLPWGPKGLFLNGERPTFRETLGAEKSLWGRELSGFSLELSTGRERRRRKTVWARTCLKAKRFFGGPGRTMARPNTPH